MVCLCVVISGFSDFFNEFFKSGIRWTLPVTDTSTADTPYLPEVETLVTTVNVTSETTNSNSLLPNTASNDIQQHVNSGDVDNDSQSDCHRKISMAVWQCASGTPRVFM